MLVSTGSPHSFPTSNMKLKTHIFVLSLVLMAACCSASAATQFYKCSVNGMTHYQQTPCPSGEIKRPPTVEELNAERQKRLLQDKENSKASKSQAQTLPTPEPAAKEREVPASVKRPVFQCDGRKYCQQMTSCEEAKYFLSHCPGVKMDGDRDGIPCEEQWCSR